MFESATSVLSRMTNGLPIDHWLSLKLDDFKIQDPLIVSKTKKLPLTSVCKRTVRKRWSESRTPSALWWAFVEFPETLQHICQPESIIERSKIVYTQIRIAIYLIESLQEKKQIKPWQKNRHRRCRIVHIRHFTPGKHWQHHDKRRNV